jgi:SRSO17 transposase
MDLLGTDTSWLKLNGYIDELVSVMVHADRAVALHGHCSGLLLPGERKSVEPMAALTAPSQPRRSIGHCRILLPMPLGRMKPC